MDISLITLGCSKNAVDSERIAGRLASMGHRIVDAVSDAQVGIVNTCGFIQDAVKENVDAILDLERMKEDGRLSHIIVAGCLVERYEAELRKELPSVDLFVGVDGEDAIAGWVASLEGGRAAPTGASCGRRILPFGTPWSRWLKVSEGCGARCSYCVIPKIRGPLRSVPVEALVDEALMLCTAGARELCLVGQDLTAYGMDLYGVPSLHSLVGALDAALPAGTWLRLLYMHPDRMTDELIDALLGADKVLHYMDMPIQHVDDEILARMARRPNGGRIRELFRRVRDADPLFALRTTIMVGFPGEGEDQFLDVLGFLEEMELDRVGAFVWSPEDGTPAASLPGRVPRDVAEERWARLMDVQSEISQERGELFIGHELDVLIEELDDDGVAWGRSYRDAPEVDGMVCVDGAGGVAPGDIVRARVTESVGHDLSAVRAGDE